MINIIIFWKILPNHGSKKLRQHTFTSAMCASASIMYYQTSWSDMIVKWWKMVCDYGLSLCLSYGWGWAPFQMFKSHLSFLWIFFILFYCTVALFLLTYPFFTYMLRILLLSHVLQVFFSVCYWLYDFKNADTWNFTCSHLLISFHSSWVLCSCIKRLHHIDFNIKRI